LDGIELVARIDCGNVLGESVLWAFPPFNRFERFVAPERISSFALLEGHDDVVLAAFESGFAFFDFATTRVSWIDRPEMPKGSRFNDGRTDRNGTFWAGVMIEDPKLRADRGGMLYRLSPDGRAEVALTGLMIPNSLCWSPDGTIMYFADSPSGVIRRYASHGSALSEGERFATVARGGFPDGSTIDAEGCLWNAEWGAGRVVRYTRDGQVDTEFRLPAPHVTCPAFGGDNLDLLFVTSARAELSDEALEAAPESGSLFVCRTPYRGLPENRCKAPFLNDDPEGR
jgi:sugar lactone lactonase YvrE